MTVGETAGKEVRFSENHLNSNGMKSGDFKDCLKFIPNISSKASDSGFKSDLNNSEKSLDTLSSDELENAVIDDTTSFTNGTNSSIKKNVKTQMSLD